ncbi:MAG: hypothetical protein P8J29_09025 [Rhodospirillales bacterium]|nr:hypothetical protein [Rhodospirillales bacterium]
MRFIFKWVRQISYAVFLLIVGWLFNFFVDIQFALGVAAGWVMRQGYDNIGRALLDLAR